MSKQKRAAPSKKRVKEKAVDPEVSEAFHLFAGDDDELDARGLQLALSALGVEREEHEAEEMLRETGKALGLREFERIALAEKKTRDDAVEAWELFDEEGRGFVTRADLSRVASELQEKFSDADLDAMLKLAENSDGIATKDSFVAFFRSAQL